MGSPGGDPFSNCLAISAWTKVVGKPIYCQCYPQCHDGCLRCFYFVQSAPLSTPPAISLSPQAHAFLRTCSSPPVHHVSLDIPASTDHLTPTSTSSPVHIPKSSPVADTPASSEPHWGSTVEETWTSQWVSLSCLTAFLCFRETKPCLTLVSAVLQLTDTHEVGTQDRSSLSFLQCWF